MATAAVKAGKDSKKILWLILLLIVAAIIYVSWDKVRKIFVTQSNAASDKAATAKLGYTDKGTTGASVPRTVNTVGIDVNKQLCRGAKGEEVRILQKFLNILLKDAANKPLLEDGNFGPLTESYVKSLNNYYAEKLMKGQPQNCVTLYNVAVTGVELLDAQSGPLYDLLVQLNPYMPS